MRDDVVGGESRSRCFSKTFRCDVVTCDVATCVACDGIPCVTCDVFTGDVLTTVALNRSMSTELRLLKLGINLNRKCKGKRWDVQLFLVRLMFCSTLIMFDNKKIGRF